MPKSKMQKPPRVAPAMNVSCIMTMLSEMAAGISSRGTSVGMIAWRVGNSNEETQAESSTIA